MENHCYGHALNLVVADAVKSVKCIGDALEVVRKIGKLVKNHLSGTQNWRRSGQKLKTTHAVFMTTCSDSVDSA